MTATVWILGDQLLNPHPAIHYLEKQLPRQELTILMIESKAQVHRYPYHPKKLVLLFSAMRHYAEELRSAGYRLDYRAAANPTEAIRAHWQAFQPNSLIMMEASSLRGRAFQRGVSRRLGIHTELVSNTQFLCEQFDPITSVSPDQPVRQEQFYRKMRKHFGLLIDERGQPVEGTWNYDQKNRQALPKSIVPSAVVSFEPDLITQSVMAEMGQMDLLTGTLAGFDLAVTREQANRAAEDFFTHRLPNFGTYEDAMRQRDAVIFHSKLAAYLNIGLLEPLALVKAAERSYYDGNAAINNVEGFIRQVIGWREYMYWQYHRLMPGLAEDNFWGYHNPLPGFFWHGDTDLNCLSQVIHRVLTLGYAHHIERLMILSNFCLLAEINPHAVYDWFSSAFIDAYEWVMVPNVFGMGLFADGGKIGTKPYIASANYINRMSDYCDHCTYDRKQRTGSRACPFNFLYWHFLLKHHQKLSANPRMARMLANLKYLDADERVSVQKQADDFLKILR